MFRETKDVLRIPESPLKYCPPMYCTIIKEDLIKCVVNILSFLLLFFLPIVILKVQLQGAGVQGTVQGQGLIAVRW